MEFDFLTLFASQITYWTNDSFPCDRGHGDCVTCIAPCALWSARSGFGHKNNRVTIFGSKIKSLFELCLFQCRYPVIQQLWFIEFVVCLTAGLYMLQKSRERRDLEGWKTSKWCCRELSPGYIDRILRSGWCWHEKRSLFFLYFLFTWLGDLFSRLCTISMISFVCFRLPCEEAFISRRVLPPAVSGQSPRWRLSLICYFFSLLSCTNWSVSLKIDERLVW